MQNATGRSATCHTPGGPSAAWPPETSHVHRLDQLGLPRAKVRTRQLPATVGRQPRAAVRLDDRRVSHFQCVIDAQDGMLTVLDLGSISGTYVNGVRRAMSTLLDGDRLTVGATDFVVRVDGRSVVG